MKTVGIICEYNPFHLGHAGHIEKTKTALNSDAAVVCVMSGNYVQRGDFAIFHKHARAKMAVLCGADIVLELPTPYALQSAGGFAKAGVHILDWLGVCDYLSFGSESGDIEKLHHAAHVIASDEAEAHIREGLHMGLPYASAQQRAADALLGKHGAIFRHPNNTLGIEYMKALSDSGSSMRAVTVCRTGGEHDSDAAGYSASHLRKTLISGAMPMDQMPGAAVAVSMEEIVLGRGPVAISNLEQAILSRLRAMNSFAGIPGSTDGLEFRFLRHARSEPTVAAVLEGIKSKRFAMSRIRRTLMCALLGITNDDIKKPPPYIRVLAMNERGMAVLKRARKTARLPIITKPASALKLDLRAKKLFNLEVAATDFYALAYEKPQHRAGGGEWRQSPIVLH